MTTKTIQMYRTNLDGSETALYPLTEAKYVTMDDGTTIEEALTNSDSSKYSPVIESSKAMFKVGEGDSVDLSESAIDGAYNSCVLKGKTMVNCIQEPSSQDVVLPYEFEDGQYITINDTKESGALGVELKGQTLVNLAENSTAYAVGSGSGDNRRVTKNGKSTKVEIVGEEVSCVVVFDSNYQLKANTKYTITFDSITTGFENTMAIGFHSNEGSYAISTRVITTNNGKNKIVLSTPSESEIVGVTVGSHGIIPIGSTIQISNMIVLEGDYTNIDIPYFEGMTSCKMPILRNVGKNLFDGEITMVNGATNLEVFNNSYSWTVTGWNQGGYFEIPVSNVSQLSMSLKRHDDTSITKPYIYVYDALDGDKNVISTSTNINETFIGSIPTNAKYVRCRFKSNKTTGKEGFKELMVSSGTITTYENHKTNILRTSEEIVLRSVGDIKDSYNALTGEYVQRIVEYVFNGSESEAWHFAETKGDNYRFSINLPTFGNKSADKTALICDRLKVGDIAQEPKQEQIATYNHDSYFELRITLSPSTLASDNVDELRRYLQANPIAIQYAVAEPTTAIIKPSTIPFAYANGHVILENGSSKQSLFPHLKYSVVTGRTGQVTQNAKVLRKQEQQIIGLEELLLTQIVQMEYERTLLQFDYELQMMMLG